MRGTWLVVMLMIVLMSVSESARISVEIAKKMTTQEEGANELKQSACDLCVYTPTPDLCRSLVCSQALPDFTHLKEEANDWKDTACSWCSLTPSPQGCVRACRRQLPGLALLKEETNDWKDYTCDDWCYNPRSSKDAEDCELYCLALLPRMMEKSAVSKFNESK